MRSKPLNTLSLLNILNITSKMKKALLILGIAIVISGIIVFIGETRKVEVSDVKFEGGDILEAIEASTEERIWDILGSYDLTLQDRLNLMMIANSEGGFDQYAINYNPSTNSFDLGHMQINTKFHPEVSRECSFNTECAIKEAVRIYKEKGTKEWSCAKNIKFFKN